MILHYIWRDKSVEPDIIYGKTPKQKAFIYASTLLEMEEKARRAADN